MYSKYSVKNVTPEFILNHKSLLLKTIQVVSDKKKVPRSRGLREAANGQYWLDENDWMSRKYYVAKQNQVNNLH